MQICRHRNVVFAKTDAASITALSGGMWQACMTVVAVIMFYLGLYIA